MSRLHLSLAALISSALLTACGGGDGDSSPSPSATGAGTFTLGVSDAPVDDVNKVVIAFEDVVLIPVLDDEDSDDDSNDDSGDDDNDSGSSFGTPIVLNVADDDGVRQVDLLQFQGSAYDTIISETSLSAGTYALCVYVKDGTELNDDSLSYVEKTDGSLKGLVVPSRGSCFGYKPQTSDQGRLRFAGKNSNVEIAVGSNQFVLEFDLRKGLADPNGKDYMLMNTNAVTLVSVSGSGEIEGDVLLTQYQACENDNNDLNAINNAPATHAIYLYAGDVPLDEMGDLGAEAPLQAPIAVASVKADDDSDNYEYEFGFVGAGVYSLGYTCTAYVDASDSQQGADEGFAIYQAYGPVTVTAGNSTDVNVDGN